MTVRQLQLVMPQNVPVLGDLTLYGEQVSHIIWIATCQKRLYQLGCQCQSRCLISTMTLETRKANERVALNT